MTKQKWGLLLFLTLLVGTTGTLLHSKKEGLIATETAIEPTVASLTHLSSNPTMTGLEADTEASLKNQLVTNEDALRFTPLTMYINDLPISYYNAGKTTGQAIIDHDRQTVATWGGKPIQSGTDGANTHFIGHNPGVFTTLFSLALGDEIVLTDRDGLPTYYNVAQLIEVDDYGIDRRNGTDYMKQIISSRGGERITLQTCLSDEVNLIVIALLSH